MAFLQTTSTGWRDLLAIIRSFAVGQGWSVSYDQITAKGQLGLSKLNCHVAIGSLRNSGDTADANVFSRTDSVNGGTLTDSIIGLALGTSLTASNTKYWGHPGSIVTTNTDGDLVQVNDLTGPFSNVWLFSDTGGNYIHIVVQSALERYTSFSFGNLDVKGATVPRCGYTTGMFHTWWPNNAVFSNNTAYDANDPGDASHLWGLVGRNSSVNFHIPTGVLNTSYSWGVTPPIITNSADSILTPGAFRSDHY